MIDWTGQVVLVTGAASGIGRATCELLATRGASIIAADIDGEGALSVAAVVGGAALQVDLADPGAAAELIARAYDRAGTVDFVCSNAGVGYNRRLLKANFDDPAIARMFEINTFAAFRLAQAWVPRLEASGRRGRLLITGSENSLSLPDSIRNFGNGIYAAAKHAVLIMAEWLASEAAAAGKPLDVHVLLPGGVYTGLTAAGLGADPDKWPAEMGIILPERAAELALAGLDQGLFYIPTHRHLIDDMRPRFDGVAEGINRLLGPDI